VCKTAMLTLMETKRDDDIKPYHLTKKKDLKRNRKNELDTSYALHQKVLKYHLEFKQRKN
jgi:hypothetical protein